MPHKLFICNKKINLLCGYLKIFFVIFLLVHFLIATHISWRWKQMDPEKNLSPLPALFFSLRIAVFFFPDKITNGLESILCSVQWTERTFFKRFLQQQIKQFENISVNTAWWSLWSFADLLCHKKKYQNLQLFLTEFLSNSLCLLARTDVLNTNSFFCSMNPSF